MKTFPMSALVFLNLLSSAAAFAGESRLTGRFAEDSAYFIKKGHWRHHRLQLGLSQESILSDHVKTVFDGRIEWDLALKSAWSQRAYSKSVIKDELFKAEGRRIYLDWQLSHAKFRVGRQIFDWTEAAAPALFDTIVPVDLRHGFSSNPSETVIPVDALTWTQDLSLNGSFQSILIPKQQNHRLAKDENGYGYYDRARQQSKPRRLNIQTLEETHSEKDMEYGVRYLKAWDLWDVSLLGFHGHQRMPAYKFKATLTTVDAFAYHPKVDTYGGTISYAREAYVGKLMLFYEPKRPVSNPEALSLGGSGTIRESMIERRYKFGLGFNYEGSEHFKLYSEHYLTKTVTVIPESPSYEENLLAGSEESYVSVFRITNASFERFPLTLDLLVSYPNESYAIAPFISHQFASGYKIELGSRLIVAPSKVALFSPLDDTDQYFIRIERNWDMLGSLENIPLQENSDGGHI